MKFDMNAPLVSINLTTKNREHFLKECIKSISIQTYKNIELIIVDDGSTDNTAKVIDSFKEILKISYIRNDNSKGNASARNSALRVSNGKYIAFMDDDDFWNDEDKIKKQVDILENQKEIALVYTEIYMFNENANTKTHIRLTEPKSLIKHFLVKNSLIYSPTVLIRKSIFDLVGDFDEKVKQGVDSSLYRKIIIKFSKNIKLLNEPTTTIRIHDGERMTVSKSLNTLFNSMHSHYYILKNYKNLFLIYPIQLCIRLSRLLKAFIKYMYFKIFKNK